MARIVEGKTVVVPTRPQFGDPVPDPTKEPKEGWTEKTLIVALTVLLERGDEAEVIALACELLSYLEQTEARIKRAIDILQW